MNPLNDFVYLCILGTSLHEFFFLSGSFSHERHLCFVKLHLAWNFFVNSALFLCVLIRPSILFIPIDFHIIFVKTLSIFSLYMCLKNHKRFWKERLNKIYLMKYLYAVYFSLSTFARLSLNRDDQPFGSLFYRIEWNNSSKYSLIELSANHGSGSFTSSWSTLFVKLPYESQLFHRNEWNESSSVKGDGHGSSSGISTFAIESKVFMALNEASGWK